jgi:hypothetical protein
MRGSDVLSRNILPLRVIPDGGKVSEYDCKPSIKQSCDVFHEDDFGSKLANNSGVLSPKSTSLTLQSGAIPGPRYVLAGESSADGVNVNSI